MARDSEERPRVNGTTLERLDSLLHDHDIPFGGQGGLDPKLNALLDELEEYIEAEAEREKERRRQEEREKQENKSGGFQVIKNDESTDRAGDGLPPLREPPDGVELPQGEPVSAKDLKKPRDYR